MATDRPDIDPAEALEELWRYSHDPDMLSAGVARWAYDTIQGLETALTLLTGLRPQLPPQPDRGSPAGAQAPIRGRWRTGRSVEPRVTLYRDDQIAGLALTAELAAEIVAGCNHAETVDPDDDMSLCDPSCPGRAGGPHQHASGY